MRAFTVALLTAAGWLATVPTVPAQPARDRLWFAPAPGAPDYLRLFAPGAEWPRARARIDVFQFYQQHTFAEGDPIVGPNTYEALARAGAFRTVVRDWGKRIALEAGSVKEFYCTEDASGMQVAIDRALASIEAVAAAGGAVSYIAMDEPFLAGQSPRCGGPRLEPTADRLKAYMSAVTRAHPSVRIGMIEAYPSFEVEDFVRMLALMRERGVPPAFLHIDAHLPALNPRRHNLARDMARLSVITEQAGVPFGVIVWGENGDDAQVFAAEAMTLAIAFGEGFALWKRAPDHIVIQSWAQSAIRVERVIPRNLPESDPHTLSGILHRVLQAWRALGPRLAIEP